VCTVGDFKYNRINWGDQTGNVEAKDILEIICNCFLHQLLSEPTKENNILDIILCNNESIVN